MTEMPRQKQTSLRAQKRIQNRDAILRAAVGVFGEQGFGATSVRDIIRRTDLATGTFYNYFDSKEDVFKALVTQVGEDLRERLRTARGAADNLSKFVENSFRIYFTYYAEHPDIFMMLRSNQTYNGTIIGMEDHQARTGLHELRSDIAAARRQNIFPDIDIDYLTAAIGGVAFALVGEMMQRRPLDPDAATIFATQLFLHGLTGYDQRHHARND
jgi:AcrR family transcriptional regulator